MAGGVNVTTQFSGDYTPYLDKKILPIALKELSVYQFADKKTLPKGYGNTWIATRWQRVPLPFAPLAESVPPAGETLTIQQVQCVAQQWGDTITVSDVAQLTIMHDPFQQAIRLIGLQEAETYERNVFNTLMGTAQVNYVNSRGSRASLVAGDVLDTNTVLRTVGALKTLGARRFMGPEEDDPKLDIGKGTGAKADASPARSPHYAAVCHTLIVADWSQNSTVILSRSYSAVNRLYNYEIGEWGGCRFVDSNMVPTFSGQTAVQGTPGTSGSLATNSGYRIIVTGQDTQNQYESYIAQVSNAISVTGPNGSISVVLPSTAGYTYNVYIGLTTSPTNLGICVNGPTTGPLAGQATQLPAGATVVITGIGIAQVPPAPPTTNITVYPTFVFGVGAYAVVTLQNVEHFMITKADKSDPLNQRAVTGWKGYMGTLIVNQQFLARIESTSAYSSSFG
jgi:N4-gp56 family major capsid protein